MNLIEDLQKNVIEGSSDLSTALRKAKVLATHLKNAEFKEWVEHELNGYPDGTEVPSYRRVHAPAFGHFSGPFGSGARNVPLPTANLPEAFRERTVDLAMRHSVRQVQGMLTIENPHYRWAAEYTMFMRDQVQMSGGAVLVDAHSVLPAAALEGILDAVRNTLLDFLLGLQAINPEVLRTDEALTSLPKEQVSQVFHVSVHGERNVVAAGQTVAQTVTSTDVTTHDEKKLLAYLASTGIEAEDLDALATALEADGPRATDSLGPKVRGWIKGMLGKAVDGSWKVAVGTAAALLQEALKRYYGWG